jgi:putative transposase
MPFTVCYYHVVWATKHRTEWLTNDIEASVLASIREISTQLKCVIYALNACANHVHVAVDIRPQIAPSDWIGRVKGTSSRQVNKTFMLLDGQFRWQKSYGLLTFGAKNLAYVVDYIERQKAHHAYGTIEPYLENTGEDE